MTPDSPDIFSAAAATVKTANFNSAFLKSRTTSLLLGLATGIMFCGCHKKSEAKAPPPETVEAAVPAAAAPASYRPAAQPLPPSSQAIAAGASADEAAGQLTLELRRYVAYTRNIPKNFDDFAAHDPIKFPPPPPEKKYVIT